MNKISRDVKIMVGLLLIIVCTSIYHTNTTIKTLTIGSSAMQATDNSLKVLGRAM